MNRTLTSEGLIDRLFGLMDEWRLLPSYQLERRADIFFALYLEQILQHKYGYAIDLVVPEFPVRVGSVSETHSELNKSFKIDYVALCKAQDKVLFIELKTDQTSRRSKQDWYLQQARNVNISKLMDGIIAIYKATNQRSKYENLIHLLSKLGWLTMEANLCKNTSRDYAIDVIYIQPTNETNDPNVISFEDIALSLSDRQDALTQRFVQSLSKWVANPNVKHQAIPV